MVIKKITLVVGARPNFVKAAPLLEALKAHGAFEARLVHTGQHFDAAMSKVFFEQLGMPEPDVNLDVNQGSPIVQIANAMMALEEDFMQYPPDLVVVFGDVNSTLAASVAANKLNTRLAHVEAGLRSFDRAMPEEPNRVLTDRLSDYLFTPSPDADKNLVAEGIPAESIHRVGNIMVDSLLQFAPHAKALNTLDEMGLQAEAYGLVTLHRQANVDDAAALEEILSALQEIGRQLPLLFPVHPRTRAQLEALGWTRILEQNQVRLVEPLGYLEFIDLMMHARLILSDSGGIQEESTVLGVPCLTLRENTERPITILEGTNRLAGTKAPSILAAFSEVISQPMPEARQPELWDGQTAQRIVDVLKTL